ncbi:HAD family hydrolase [Bacillus sp. AK031]
MDSIIFDLDGTLWDSMDSVLVVWNRVLQGEGVNRQKLTREDFSWTMGLQIKEIGNRLFPDLDDNGQKQLLKTCCAAECEYLGENGGDLYENVEMALSRLSQKYKLCIVSNCQDGYIEAFYKYHNLEQYFLDYENPGRTGLSKGENIKLIMERNGLSNPVYIGDTEGDLSAARYAGIPFVYARYGFGQVSEHDYCIEGFDELLKLF